MLSSSQQQPSQTQKPIFSQNPLKFMINNEYSGTLHINNLNHINKLYDVVRDALIQQNSQNVSLPSETQSKSNNIFFTTTQPVTSGTVLFATHNPNNPKPVHTSNSHNQTFKTNKLFSTVKGQKIFNIIKEPNNKLRKSVKIVYNNDDKNIDDLNHNYNYNNYEYSEDNREEHFKAQDKYYENREEEYNDNGEEEEKLNGDEVNENLFEDDYNPTWANMFK